PVLAWKPEDKASTVIEKGPGGFYRVVGAGGKILVSSRGDSTAATYETGQEPNHVTSVPSPADTGHDAERSPALSRALPANRVDGLGTGTRVLILTGLPQEQQVLDVLEAGAPGFVGKAGPVEDLTRAIRTVMQGRRFLGADAARVVVLQRYLRERRVAGVPRKRWGKGEGGKGEGVSP